MKPVTNNVDKRIFILTVLAFQCWRIRSFERFVNTFYGYVYEDGGGISFLHKYKLEYILRIFQGLGFNVGFLSILSAVPFL